MVKLNVTIPAVDVMVNGQAYRKVDRKAQAGDIVKALYAREDITEGAFYAVYADGDGDPAFRDDDGDERCVFLEYRDRYETFAPVTPAAPSDSITFGGDTYRKVDRSAREGDVVVFPEAPYSYITSGKAYLVHDVDSHGDAQVSDDDGDSYDTAGDPFDVYEKVTEESAPAPTLPAVEYREVKRWAEKGERIRIVNRDRHEHSYEQGAEFIVNDTDGDGDVRVTLGGRSRKLVSLSEYAVLEPITASEYVEVKRKADVGERIKIIAAGYAGMPPRYQNGDEIVVIHSDGHSVRGEGIGIYIRHDEYVVLEPVTPTADTYVHNGITYRKESRVANVGELVLVVANTMSGNSHGYSIGEVTEIIEEWPRGSHGPQRKGSGKSAPYMATADYLVLVPISSAETAPTPLKYAAGDYVKVTGNSVHHNYDVGSVVRLVDVENRDSSEGQRFHAEKADGSRGNWLVTNDVEPADEGAFEAQKKPKRLTVGDYAKVVGDDSGHNYVLGTVVKIVTDDNSSAPYRAEKEDGETGNWLGKHDVEPATEAEFLAAKRLKVGDFAKVIDASGSVRAKLGDIVKVSGYANWDEKLLRAETLDGREYAMFTYRFTQATPEEVAAAQRKIAVGPFTDGGFAQIVNATEETASPTPRRTPNAFVRVETTTESRLRALKVTYPDGDFGFCNADALRQITEAEYNAAVAPKTPEPAFSVGDTVKLTVADGKSPHYGWGEVKNGDVGEVIDVLSDKVRVKFPKQNRWNGKPGELTKLTQQEDPRDAFVKDDKVRLISGAGKSGLHGFKDGEIYTVDNPKTTSWDSKKIKIKDAGLSGYALPEQLVKLSAEDIAASAKEAQETAKWAAIGRKVGAFKRGDVVKGTGMHSLKPEMGTVQDVGTGIIGVSVFPSGYSAMNNAEVTLIVPVEQRFDTEQAAA